MNIIKKHEKISSTFWIELGAQLRDQLKDQLGGQLWDKLGGQLRPQLRDKLTCGLIDAVDKE